MTHIADILPTKWSPDKCGSGTWQGKSAGQRPKSQPLSYIRCCRTD